MVLRTHDVISSSDNRTKTSQSNKHKRIDKRGQKTVFSQRTHTHAHRFERVRGPLEHGTWHILYEENQWLCFVPDTWCVWPPHLSEIIVLDHDPKPSKTHRFEQSIYWEMDKSTTPQQNELFFRHDHCIHNGQRHPRKGVCAGRIRCRQASGARRWLAIPNPTKRPTAQYRPDFQTPPALKCFGTCANK